jgi:NADH-quinone oxidoreductase subunit K
VSPVLAAIPPSSVLHLAAALFVVGMIGVACRRNVLVMLLSVEIMLNAANLAFVAFSKVHGGTDGQIFVFFAMTVAAAEVAVGLAIVIAVYRLRRVADADAASDLREEHVGEVGPIVPEGPAGTPPHAHDPADPHADGQGPPEHETIPELAAHAQAHDVGHEEARS